ncbi:uncharacterized protein LOC111904040 [Lactuca sativa]|uniref:uncharacterized protein LOC111904040 n=1 Tax=Lactuca sativa TaxID=4236 RepID=UPI000CD9D43D|nr:uncharacterized protein LOC111904040 [Lactuca sativa]XP_042753199.1 uncharacterized protein LOC111904040 [Lactuca sativa]
MVATAIILHFRPLRHRHLLLLQNATSSLRFSSSSSSNSDDNGTSQSQSQPQSSSSSSSDYFSDVKASLKQTPQQPRRSSSFSSNPSPRDESTQKLSSMDDIRKSLSGYTRVQPPPPPQPKQPVISFQELYKRSVMPKADQQSGAKTAPSLDSIRMSLNHMPPQSQQPRSPLDGISQSLKYKIPSTKAVVSDETKAEFVRMYSYGEMGEKLRKLRPVNKTTKFSLGELSERLKMLREIEEKEIESTNGLKYMHLRESLKKLQDDGITKKNAAQRANILGQLGGTPSFMSSPPKEVLVEKYFHPDHMSSAEKQKIELKNVRDKFKISESDCGSARVQVAQLTTKIKHLATVLHKKDKHSRKGLQAMVQKRKKLLKYLRRTDWDSYCFCLSELGLRDSADYKL